MSPKLDDRPAAVKFDELCSFTQEAMARLHVPGCSLGLVAEGQDYLAAYGVTSLENPLPVTPETLFQIGSTTKTFTSTCIFHLIDQGKLSLDDPVRKYLPDFKMQDEDAASRATIRNLLNHTGGWLGDFFVDTGDGDDALAKYIEKMAEAPQLTPLGALYAYNNASFNLAGRVLEAALDKPYETIARELVLEPLEMSHSYFFPKEVMEHRFAAGHTYKEQENKVILARPWAMNRGEAPCGGLCSDIPDQLKYAHFHMGDGTTAKGERLLSPESLRRMQTPSVTTDDDGWMGMNWFLNDVGGVRIVSHGGSTNGQQSAFWMAPEKGVALTVLTNLDQGTRLHGEITQWVYEHFLGVAETEPTPLELPEEALREYAGCYTMAPTGDIFEFRITGGGYTIYHTLGDYSMLTDTPPDPFPPMAVRMYTDSRFVFTEPPFKGFKGEFLRNPDGRVAWMRFSGRIMARQT